MVAAQALEQAIELLQPGTGGCTVVGLGQQRQFGQRGETHRVQRLFGAYDRALLRNESAQFPDPEADHRQQQQQQPPARCRRPEADR
ncbi:hypothetical protein D3C76_1691370 [compost metagenome]